MREKIFSIVNRINESYEHRDTLSLSLLQGEAGYCLFEKFYVDFIGKNISKTFNDNLQNLAENSLSVTFPTFCSGKAGINSLFSYLHQNKILSSSDWKAICSDDKQLANRALGYLRSKCFDFLHGGVGIAYHLVHSRGYNGIYKKFFHDFFSLLKSLVRYNNNEPYFPDFDMKTKEPILTRVNLGLAHGVTSILKYCVQCYKHNICREEAREIAFQVIKSIRSHSNKDVTESYFPYAAPLNPEIDEKSRLAWCYGDLGIGIILYQASQAFNDDELESYALKILLHTATRLDYKTTHVVDAGLCHGTAGIAHIYNKMYSYTQNNIFKNACEYWILKTMDLNIYSDGVGGYKSYHGPTNSFKNNYALLEGPSGIGLALMSYVTGDFSWDYCLMLND